MSMGGFIALFQPEIAGVFIQTTKFKIMSLAAAPVVHASIWR